MWKKMIGLVFCMVVLLLPMMNVCAANGEVEASESIETFWQEQCSESTQDDSTVEAGGIVLYNEYELDSKLAQDNGSLQYGSSAQSSVDLEDSSEQDNALEQDSVSTQDGSSAMIMLAYTNSTYTNLAIASGTATCISGFTGYPGITNRVDITMYLQKRYLIFWINEEIWSQTFYGYNATMSKNTDVSGGTYRVKAVYVAYCGNANETVTGYSSNVTY